MSYMGHGLEYLGWEASERTMLLPRDCNYDGICHWAMDNHILCVVSPWGQMGKDPDVPICTSS